MAWLEDHLKLIGGATFCAAIVTLEAGVMPATYALFALTGVALALIAYLRVDNDA